jgi:hypothetical protein
MDASESEDKGCSHVIVYHHQGPRWGEEWAAIIINIPGFGSLKPCCTDPDSRGRRPESSSALYSPSEHAVHGPPSGPVQL